MMKANIFLVGGPKKMNVTTGLKRWLVVVLFLLTIASAANAKTIYVDIDRHAGGRWSESNTAQ